MKMERFGFLYLVVVFTICVRLSSACTCDFPHPQNKFCSADFVVKATIIEEKLEFGEDVDFPLMKHYKIQYKKRDILKGEHLLGSQNEAVIKTSGTPWNCGMTFTLNTEYLISGHAQEGELFTNLCEWNKEFSRLKEGNHLQRRGIRRMYERGCNCTVFHCRGDACYYPEARGLNPDHVCLWEGSYNTNDCYARFGFCLPDTFGLCYWKDNRKLANCLNPDRESRR
ncbi:metalloproteinase inhibitor 1 isoform X2 [Ostrea edulis]|nr:metalloproteinase inhibitor 1 isoform X2 [Ostrea edulis]